MVGVSRGNLPSPQGAALALPRPSPPLALAPHPFLGLLVGIGDPRPWLSAGSCSRPPAASPGQGGSCTGQRDPQVGSPGSPLAGKGSAYSGF